MRINSLSLENYRNIIRCDLTPGEGVNLIVGDNAQGKTNLMEAIWLLTGEKTFRYGREHDIPRLDMDRETQRTRSMPMSLPRDGIRNWNISSGPGGR